MSQKYRLPCQLPDFLALERERRPLSSYHALLINRKRRCIDRQAICVGSTMMNNPSVNPYDTSACFDITSDLWVGTPGDCDTSHSVGRHDATAWAFCNSDMQQVVVASGDDARASPLAGRGRCAVLVMHP